MPARPLLEDHSSPAPAIAITIPIRLIGLIVLALVGHRAWCRSPRWNVDDPSLLLRDLRTGAELARLSRRRDRRSELPDPRARHHRLPRAAGALGLELRAPPRAVGDRPAAHRLDRRDRARHRRPRLHAGARELAAAHRAWRPDRRRLHQSRRARHRRQSAAGHRLALRHHPRRADAGPVLARARSRRRDACPRCRRRRPRPARARPRARPSNERRAERRSGRCHRRPRASGLLAAVGPAPRHRQSARKCRRAPRSRSRAVARRRRRAEHGAAVRRRAVVLPELRQEPQLHVERRIFAPSQPDEIERRRLYPPRKRTKFPLRRRARARRRARQAPRARSPRRARSPALAARRCRRLRTAASSASSPKPAIAARAPSIAPERLEAMARRLEGVLAGFRRQGRHHQCPPRPGGHALRTRARARHQVEPRDLARRRHRPLDERHLGPRRRRARPQRHRHRTAQRERARPSICAKCWRARTSRR